ncbi:lipopolysaccharide transport periplasmic protein LptA [Providencia rettgeri]|uniref:lipopolysaccharide transport periplasmic protein LptA n=1 Tax=Providencia rettgeri TaxID=587 RepID=UPI00141916B1|nr:lipopolysaccharide transport periplasmic protein LptA [Providencia rettgeri]NIA80950.1 lipopolysaccharide transport periplasmic protein LptA [Providencia rettgeri]NIB04194.1 lipopolysaccharide transport periplasmic protein LptA [Providencia rettgeri]NIB08398.1 lipopolysaccharide transport periplasmic protein LptA [Providencia rettgeri]NIB22003.1 lipopolysaccharide transport periplasmic protein LptA [Providencia rettgeri]NIB30416.1 lipopolysaccharide transport periplasmic protein LptA [Provi
MLIKHQLKKITLGNFFFSIKSKPNKIILLLMLTSYIPCSLGDLSNQYNVYSDKQLLLSNGNVKAIGNVIIISGNMKVSADEAIYHYNKLEGAYITAKGTPIRYNGVLEDGKKFKGTSKNLKYIINKYQIILIGDAFIEQENNTLSAPIITYNIRTKNISASSHSDPKQRVKSVIYPETIKNNK